MNNYFSIKDVDSIDTWVNEAIEIKKNPLSDKTLGADKTIGLLFFNPSLRTRLSTQKAALNLGMNVIVMNFTGEGWSLEYGDGAVMDQGNSEHVKEAAQVVSQYCDVLAIRAFAKLENRDDDYEEKVLKSFIKYTDIPVINMESATGHPLQALTDAITITENKPIHKPKIVLSWAPHPKALPQAVANSFVEMAQQMEADFVITHPVGFELASQITNEVPIDYNQENALKDADFVYVKNWSSYEEYGKTSQDQNWKITKEKMKLTNNAKFMHCLPVRRNVVIDDAVIDSDNSIVIEQANNRTYAAQLVLKKILETT
ncbi:N-succinyl-L-ornithine transcarbamylase [Aquimarina amphilecti]|uniref:N-succinylornithine carbamoyltransferase n=1 Tax=Aquimarina amphilecti TaxID=1038014 RepID=A0A1H7QG39_AQUAM|nr:N-acetylornithine carbamoyltransferase [Aquimarina amphilecti]SEL46893.1 N-succinyl-L-ornithine transcarbamylase [Aquimarina amphilecti]